MRLRDRAHDREPEARSEAVRSRAARTARVPARCLAVVGTATTTRRSPPPRSRRATHAGRRSRSGCRAPVAAGRVGRARLPSPSPRPLVREAGASPRRRPLEPHEMSSGSERSRSTSRPAAMASCEQSAASGGVTAGTASSIAIRPRRGCASRAPGPEPLDGSSRAVTSRRPMRATLARQCRRTGSASPRPLASGASSAPRRSRARRARCGAASAGRSAGRRAGRAPRRAPPSRSASRRARRRAARPRGRRPARRFSTPRFHGHTSWQMSQP